MLGERIKFARLQSKLTQPEIAQMLGVSKAAVSKWEKGDNTPKELDRLAKILHVSLDWLRTGKGQVKRTDEIMKELNKIPVDEWDDSTPLETDEVEVPYYKSIELAAGAGATSEIDYDGYKLRFGKRFFRRKGVQKENVLCFPARGNSMEPVIPNGATVSVDTAKKEIIDGDIYAICQDNLYRLKRLYLAPNNKVRINSFNSDEHPDETADLKEVEIIGRVFHCSFEL
ncbi:phage repressor protein C with HTH and peptisase S24 domain [Orbus hercynius]|uniref:Phage repressor protein C with HTH and peptisase S24 domain n=1 Tax=Orbus hercynius TaxID=593135 RepID=A0A495RI07_9GAMM|nr:helix-turn-helix transcriptional regulator [Orbus hercynius]RKS86904.1 phage repressor protein C with HTH and peptisase S24 domain [Orbus hercynius]